MLRTRRTPIAKSCLAVRLKVTQAAARADRNEGGRRHAPISESRSMAFGESIESTCSAASSSTGVWSAAKRSPRVALASLPSVWSEAGDDAGEMRLVRVLAVALLGPAPRRRHLLEVVSHVPWTCTARWSDWRIHHVAYVENLKPRPPVELLDGAHQAERAFLDQIGEVDFRGLGSGEPSAQPGEDWRRSSLHARPRLRLQPSWRSAICSSELRAGADRGRRGTGALRSGPPLCRSTVSSEKVVVEMASLLKVLVNKSRSQLRNFVGF